MFIVCNSRVEKQFGGRGRWYSGYRCHSDRHCRHRRRHRRSAVSSQSRHYCQLFLSNVESLMVLTSSTGMVKLNQ